MQRTNTRLNSNSWAREAIKNLYFCTLVFIFICSSAIYSIDETSPLIWIFCIASIFLLLMQSTRNPPILIISCYALYIAASPYYLYFKQIPLTAWSEFHSLHHFGPTLYHLTCFIVFFSLCLASPPALKFESIKERLNTPNNTAFYLALTLALIALKFGITGDTILDAAYYQGETDRSALHEYFILPYFGLLVFANHESKIHKTTINLLLVLFILKTAIYGGRVEIIQVTLLYIYFNLNFLRNTKTWKIFMFAGMAFLIFSLVGMARSDVFGLLQKINSPNSVIELFSRASEPAYISNTSSEVIYSSARLHGMVEIDSISTSERILSFLTFTVNALAPSSIWPDYTNLSRYKSDIHPSNGGALISSYFYVWLDIIGPIIAGIAAGVVIRKSYFGSNKYLIIYATLALISFPRWLTYNPSVLVKFCIIGTILIIALDQIRMKQTKNKKKPTNNANTNNATS